VETVIWLTGLAASGKTTTAMALKSALVLASRRPTVMIDAEDARRLFWPDLGHEVADCGCNVTRLAYLARHLAMQNIRVIVSAISPLESYRHTALAKIEKKILVLLRCPMEVLRRRDYKGLYEAADRGLVKNLAGVHFPYEEPVDKPDVVLDTDRMDTMACVSKIMDFILKNEL